MPVPCIRIHNPQFPHCIKNSPHITYSELSQFRVHYVMRLTPILVQKLQIDIAVLMKRTKWLLRHISLLQNKSKCICDQAPPKTLLEKLTALSIPPSWTWRPFLGGQGKQRLRTGREGRRGEWRRMVSWVCPVSSAVVPDIVGWLVYVHAWRVAPVECIRTKSCPFAVVPDLITRVCAKVRNEIFRDYNLTGIKYSIFPISILARRTLQQLMRCITL